MWYWDVNIQASFAGVFTGNRPELAKVFSDGLLGFDTEAGEEYLVALTPEVQAPLGEEDVTSTSPLTHMSSTKRHLFIGEDADTAYYRALDGATRAWYVGNLCHVNHTLYKLDMGATAKKDYWREFPAQAHCDAGRTMKCIPFIPIAGEAIAFTPKQGYTAGGDIVRAGHYQCELIPVMQKRDEPIRLRISTAEGKRWKLNLVILNVHKGY